MSLKPQIEPIPTLSYFEDRSLASFLALRRWVLIAGLISGAAIAVATLSNLTLTWPAGLLLMNVTTVPLRLIYFYASIATIMSATGASIGCRLMLQHPSARLYTACAEVLLVGCRALQTSLQLVDLLTRQNGGFPFFRSYQIIQLIAALVPSGAISVLVILLLLRKETEAASVIS